MLIRYSVENYLSFDKRQILSMAASQGTRHKDHIIEKSNHKLLKSAVIFGANASGKSNLIYSIAFSTSIVLNGLEKVDLNNKYFKIKKQHYKKPGVFQYDFLIEDKIYSYGFAISYERKQIISEWLYTGEENDICVFERVWEDETYSIRTDMKLKGSDATRFKIYCEDYKNSKNLAILKKLFLSDIALRASKDSEYFRNYIEVLTELANVIILFPESKYQQLGNVAKNQDLKELFEKFLLCFDTGIEKVENMKIEFDKMFNDAPKEQIDRIKQDISNKIHKKGTLNLRVNDDVISLNLDNQGNILASKMLLNHGNDENLFECSEESDGTQRLFDLIPLFFRENNNRLVIIDEIDRSLHNKLSRKFLELYYELSKNNKSQIIVTTHETSLLDLDLLRQDEIWFIEREKDHSSLLYSLNKFKERYDKSVEKEYLLGKYGAVPVFNQFAEDD